MKKNNIKVRDFIFIIIILVLGLYCLLLNNQLRDAKQSLKEIQANIETAKDEKNQVTPTIIPTAVPEVSEQITPSTEAEDSSLITPTSLPEQSLLEEGDNAEDNIKLYFSDSNAQYIVGEERNLKNLTPAKAIQALIQGPKSSELFTSLPKEVEVVDVTVKDGVAYVNLAENVPTKERGNYGSSSSTYNIINSICATLILHDSFGINKVKLEGGFNELLSGVDTETPFEVDMTYVKE